MANGYMGKILWVDLSKNKIWEESANEEICRKFLGGYGLGAYLLFTRMKAGADPLGSDNILGFITGPLTGTPSLGGSRYAVVGKSPLTGGWGDANSGGFFGPHLKFAGYDAVFFTGISPRPVYLFIDSGKAELRDAGQLWGKDSFETEDILKEKLGRDMEVACIGPSGEKLSLIAAIMNNHGRAAARSGLGAVMGSKKIKAIAVKGNNTVPLAHEEKAKEVRKNTQLTGHITMLNQFGTPAILIPLVTAGDSPIKNWAGFAARDFPDAEPLGGPAVVEKQERRYACYRCRIACGGRMKGGTGEYKYPPGGHKPEYETLCMFGTNCLNNNLDSIIMANDICNRYGLDTISAGAVIAMAIECYENGLITREDTGGIEMTWGNHKAIVAMTEKLARREGFGDILADGVKVAAERIGKGADKFAMHIQGQEFPAHDPKYGFNWAIAYKMDATPGRHCQGPGKPVDGLPLPPFDRMSQQGMQPGYKAGTNFMHVIQSLGQCIFVYWAMPNIEVQMDAIKTVTGWDVTFDELFLTGERINNMRHLFNLREGLNPLHFAYPDRMAGRPPREEGPLKGITLNEELLFGDYLKAMDWDPVTTRPSKKKLEELGLQDIVAKFWPE